MAVLRLAAAVAVGALVVALLGYGATIFVVVLRIGVPLGAPGGPWMTPADYLVLLLLVGLAAAVGGRVASRLAPTAPRAAALALAAVLAVAALWLFTAPGVGWPRWWGFALAAVMGVGAVLAGPRRRVRR